MKEINDIRRNQFVVCKTFHQAKEFLNRLHSAGIKCKCDTDVSCPETCEINWYRYGENTAYYLSAGLLRCVSAAWLQKDVHTFFDASEFIGRNCNFGEKTLNEIFGK